MRPNRAPDVRQKPDYALGAIAYRHFARRLLRWPASFAKTSAGYPRDPLAVYSKLSTRLSGSPADRYTENTERPTRFHRDLTFVRLRATLGARVMFPGPKRLSVDRANSVPGRKQKKSARARHTVALGCARRVSDNVTGNYYNTYTLCTIRAFDRLPKMYAVCEVFVATRFQLTRRLLLEQLR